MNYLILSQNSLDYGWQLSAALWQLASPAPVQATENRRSQYWSTPIAHADGRVALPLPDSAEFIHPQADLSVLTQFIDAAPAEEQAAIAELIASNRGSTMSFAEALSAAPSFSDQIKTHSQLEADNWFPQPEL